MARRRDSPAGQGTATLWTMDDAALTFVARLDDEATSAARNLRGTMDSLGGPIDPIEGDIIMRTDKVDKAVGHVKGVNDEIVADSDKSGKEAGDQLAGGFTNALKSGITGGAIGGIAAEGARQLADGIGGMFESAINLEPGRDKMAAQLGLSAQDSQRIGQVAGDLYAGAWGDSAESVNDAVAAVYSSIDGMSAASSSDLQAVTEDALNFAEAFDVDINRAAQVAGQTIRTGLAADADEAFDLIVASSQRVPANLREDLLDAADEYGPFFAQLGLSGEEAFGALVAGADRGMYGIDKTGDALKELTIRATDMSTNSVAAYEAAGLSADDMAARFLQGGDVAGGAMQELVDGLLSIEDPTEQANAAIALFGTPLEDLGTDKIPDFLKSLQAGGDELEGFGGAADRMGETLNDNAATNIESFKRQLSTTATDIIGGTLLPKFDEVASFLSDTLGPAFKHVTEWIDDHQQIVSLLTTVLGTAVGTFLVVIGAIKTWTAVQAILNVVMTANPIGLVIAAIAALVAAIVWIATQTTWFQDIWSAVWGWITDVVQAVVDWWNNTLVPAWDKVVDKISGALQSIGDFFASVWQWIVDRVKGAVDVVKGIIQRYFDTYKAIIRGAVDGIKAIINWFAELPGKIRGWFGGVRDGIRDKMNAAVEWIKGVPNKVLNALGDLGRLLVNAGKRIIEGLWNGLKQKWEDVKNWFGGIGTWIRNHKGPEQYDKTLLTDPGRWIMQSLADGLDDGLGTVEDSLANVTRTVMRSMDIAGAMTPSTTVAGRVTSDTEVVVRHVVELPDGTTGEYTAEEWARLIAADPSASSVLEKALRRQQQQRKARTLEASN